MWPKFVCCVGINFVILPPTRLVQLVSAFSPVSGLFYNPPLNIYGQTRPLLILSLQLIWNKNSFKLSMTGFEPGVSGVRIKSPHLLTALGGRHRSVVSSAPTILQPRVRIPSSPSTLFFKIVLFKLYRENKQKEAGIGPFFFVHKDKVLQKNINWHQQESNKEHQSWWDQHWPTL